MSEEATPMRTNRPGRADDLAVRVASPTERMRLGVGACRRLDGALIDRQVLFACAAEFSESPRVSIGVRRIARLVGVPSEVVWEVVARHSLLDDPVDQWVIFAYTSPWDDDARPAEPGPPPPAPLEGLIGVWGCSDLSLRLTYPEWPSDFIDLGLRRWTDDLLALSADLVARAWGPFGDRYQAAAWFLGEVFECLEPEWSLHLWADGMQRVHGNLAARAVEMPSRRVVPHRDHDPVRARMLPESVRRKSWNASRAAFSHSISALSPNVSSTVRPRIGVPPGSSYACCSSADFRESANGSRSGCSGPRRSST